MNHKLITTSFFAPLIVSAALVTLATFGAPDALASAKCTKHPKNEWIPEAEMKKRITDQGYKIKKFKIDGDCYEIYGWNKEQKKVEIYFDTKTGEIVKSEIN